MAELFKERFQDQVIIITGGATGIGAVAALRAVKEGARVVIADRKKEEGLATLAQIQEIGEGMFLHLDLAEEKNAEAMVAETIKKYGHVDGCVNNAGVISRPTPVHLLEKEALEDTMADNFYSMFFCCKYELRQLILQGQGGALVNVASIAGLTGIPGNPPYNASKFACNGLTKNMALDYAKYGIRVNSINPDGTTTPLAEQAMRFVMESREAAKKAGKEPDNSMAGLKTTSLFKRPSEAEEQASVILFLLSKDASHITGATVATDGGWTCY